MRIIVLLCLVLTVVPARAADLSFGPLERQVRRIADATGGTVGVSVRHLESGQRIMMHGDTVFPLADAAAVPVAVALLRKVDDGTVHLTDGVAGRTLDDLLHAMIAANDARARDIILRTLGGPAATSAVLRAAGLRGVGVGRATPDASVAMLARLYRGQLLRPASTHLLLGLLGRTHGPARIRAGVPRDHAVLDKTGTGPGIVCDIGIATLPGRRGHVAIAIFVRGSTMPSAAQNRAIAAITRAAYAHWAR